MLSEKLTGLLKSAGLRARGEMRKTGQVFPEGGTNAAFQKILRILWLNVVQPVVEGLAYHVCCYNNGGPR